MSGEDTGVVGGGTVEVTESSSPEVAAMSSEISADLFGAAEPSAPAATEGDVDITVDTSKETPVEKPAEAPAAETKPAPRTWRPEAAAKWAELPPEVRAEVEKREQEIFDGIEQYKADAQIGRGFTDILRPYSQILTQYNIDPGQLISQMMQAHYTLSFGSAQEKADAFARLQQTYGVTQQDGVFREDTSEVQGLRKQIQELQSRLDGRDSAEMETARKNVMGEIEAFAADPAHPYFDEVANDIAAILNGKGAKTLAEAYEKAIWANPVTRAKEQARIDAERKAAATKEAKEKADKARAAAGANVISKDKVSGGTAATGSIEDTLNATMAEIAARG